MNRDLDGMYFRDRMSTAITHARRETKFRAGEERVESND